MPAGGSSRSAPAEAGVARTIGVRVAAGEAERARHHEIRRAVFCDEQGLFDRDDRDPLDADPATLHVVGLVDGEIFGTVRLYPLGPPGLWQGDRLAVLQAMRQTRLGAALVRFAVRTAGERGGDRMVAMIQLPNVRFFEGLGWHAHGAVVAFHGRDHQPMTIALGRGAGS